MLKMNSHFGKYHERLSDLLLSRYTSSLEQMKTTGSIGFRSMGPNINIERYGLDVKMVRTLLWYLDSSFQIV